MITIGELYDALKEIDAAEKTVAEWERGVSNGGSPDTMKRKMGGLESARDWLEFLRSQPIDPPPELDAATASEIATTDYRE